jgi:hypothetical protein
MDPVQHLMAALLGGILGTYAIFLWYITWGHRDEERQSVVATADDDPPAPRTPPSAL